MYHQYAIFLKNTSYILKCNCVAFIKNNVDLLLYIQEVYSQIIYENPKDCY